MFTTHQFGELTLIDDGTLDTVIQDAEGNEYRFDYVDRDDDGIITDDGWDLIETSLQEQGDAEEYESYLQMMEAEYLEELAHDSDSQV